MKEFDFFDMLSELHKLSKLILQKKMLFLQCLGILFFSCYIVGRISF